MENLLDKLEPSLLWNYFLELCKIPHGSKNEAEALRWVADQARTLGCDVKQDSLGNLLITKPGTRGKENLPSVCLQAHIDMVCEKNEGTEHDFLKDPLKVYRDGDLLKAKGTTLGADDGIGVAIALAVLVSKDIAHGPLEVLITVQEEIGLIGAVNMPNKWLKSKYLLNLDGDKTQELTIGCAGGNNTIAKRQITLSPPKGGNPYKIKVSGLLGGHSGMDINLGRGNAIRVLAQTLLNLRKDFQFELANFECTNKHNAIPREAVATVFFNPGEEARFKATLAKQASQWKATLGAFDPDLTIALLPEKAENITQVMSEADHHTLIAALLSVPHGIETMSPDVPGLVQTSTNLGIVNTKGDTIEITFCNRSSIEADKQALSERIGAALSLAGFAWDLANGFPGWKPEPDAYLVKLCSSTYESLFGQALELHAVHAGLECGIIGEKNPGMEMVSLGPDMLNYHTPEEQLSVSGTNKTWKFVQALLEKIQ